MSRTVQSSNMETKTREEAKDNAAEDWKFGIFQRPWDLYNFLLFLHRGGFVLYIFICIYVYVYTYNFCFGSLDKSIFVQGMGMVCSLF